MNSTNNLNDNDNSIHKQKRNSFTENKINFINVLDNYWIPVANVNLNDNNKLQNTTVSNITTISGSIGY